ncbi:hypothetical protein [Mucilaginibacter gracilis]|nr:hypothetical protein [Mucilaginibacter gracilis]
MRKLFLIWALSLVVMTAHAQSKSEDSDINKITWLLFKNYNPDASSLNQACIKSCVFIHFQINENGKFTNIGYTKNTPQFIIDGLANSFKIIEPSIKQMNLHFAANQTYLLPFEFYYNLGCDFSGISKNTPDSTKPKPYVNVEADMQLFGDALWDILNFTDGKLELLNCTVLRPVRTGAVH